MSRTTFVLATSVLAALASVSGLASAAGVAPAASTEAAANAAVAPATVVFNNDTVDVTAERPLLRYRYGGVAYKPYVDLLFTPSGVNILRDSPHDHVHHHALMYAIDVNGVNFWEEQQAPGAERHRAFGDVRIEKLGGATSARFTEHLDWVVPRSGDVLLKETRTLEALAGTDLPATMARWETRLNVPPGKDSVVLTGSHYHGLGMRFLISMDKGGTFMSATGSPGDVFRGTERLGAATWCAYTAEADGKRVTVAMFGHPENPRGPATLWFTMTEPFAYLSATLNLHREPITLKAGPPLVLRYGIALWDGAIEPKAIEAAYQRYVALPLPTAPGN